MAKNLEVNPIELNLAAGRIDEHAETFLNDHQTAQWRAGDVLLGSGLASAALPEMLAAWEADAARFGQHFAHYAEGHRTAANAYVHTDADSAESIGDLG